MNQFMNLTRVEFAVTYNCSSKCAHCFVSEGTRKKYPGHIGTNGAVILQEIATLFQLESVMTFGGEPLLYPEDICSIHQTATELGIPTRQIITNGYWSKNPERIREVANMVVESGVNNLLISIDAFHDPYIPVDHLKKVARAFIDLGLKKIKWNPCWVKSTEDNNLYNQRTRILLEEVAGLELPIGGGNVVSPNGAAINNLAEYMPPKQTYPVGRCEDQPYISPLDQLKSISVGPRGDIFICPNFALGNAFVDNMEELLMEYNPYQIEEMKYILKEGAEGLLGLARERGISLAEDGYFTICQMCKEVVES